MQINIFVDAFPTYSETFIYNQIQGFVLRGFKVNLYCQSLSRLDQNNHNSIKFIRENCKVVNIGTPHSYKRKCLALIPAFLQVLRKSGLKSLKILNIFSRQGDNKALSQVFTARTILNDPPDGLIICHFGVHGVILTTLLKAGLLGAHNSIVTYFHGCDFSSYVARRRKDVYAQLFSLGALFVANSEFTKTKLISLGAEPSKVVKIPVSYNENIFTYCDRQKLDLNPVVFLSIGRLTEKKGHSYLISAFKKVLSKGLDAKLWIVGEGDLRNDLQTQIQSLSLEGSVKLLGQKTQKEISTIFQTVHVFILASITANNGDTEGQGLVLQEAQAVGLPVIATQHNGFPDSIQENRTGFLVPERDTESLAKKMLQLGLDSELRETMGRAGAAFAEESFASEVILSRTEDLILSKFVR